MDNTLDVQMIAEKNFDIYKIEWDHLTSPINLGSKINGYTLESYNQTFVVINEELLVPKYKNELDEMYNVNSRLIIKNVGRIVITNNEAL